MMNKKKKGGEQARIVAPSVSSEFGSGLSPSMQAHIDDAVSGITARKWLDNAWHGDLSIAWLKAVHWLPNRDQWKETHPKLSSQDREHAYDELMRATGKKLYEVKEEISKSPELSAYKEKWGKRFPKKYKKPE
jgi:hypothetical protein